MFSLGFWQVGRFVTHHFSTFAYVYDVLSRPEDESAKLTEKPPKQGKSSGTDRQTDRQTEMNRGGGRPPLVGVNQHELQIPSTSIVQPFRGHTRHPPFTPIYV